MTAYSTSVRALHLVTNAASGAAHVDGAHLGQAREKADEDPAARRGMLVLDASLGEQQRGTAGLLDRPTSLLRRR